MIPRECKRLAEVDFPIAAVSRHSARERSIRHGHPSTLHLWWARRALPACRAVLMELLLPDPCDPHCPLQFKMKARKALKGIPNVGAMKDDEALRKALLIFVGDFANWDHSTTEAYLTAARSLVRAAHGDQPPLVVDPFAGGGSIPLEALRVGCEAFASDLNPVACLILKVLLEDIPRRGANLAEELRRVGAEMKAAAEKELSEYYPTDPDGSKPIAYLWARTVRCESPNCGAEIPLVRSFWLCKKANRRRALRYEVRRPEGKPPYVEFEVFEPGAESDVPRATVARANASCPCCNTVLPASRVRAQLVAQHGGSEVSFATDGKRAGGATLLAVVTVNRRVTGRHYRVATPSDYAAVHAAQRVAAKLPKGAVPDEPVDEHHHDVNRLPMYGMPAWGDAFTARQKIVLAELSRAVARLHLNVDSAASPEAAALAVDRLADYSSSLCRWVARGEYVGNSFSRQALAAVWDFCEINPFSDSTGGFPGAVEWIASVAESIPGGLRGQGQVQLADARTSPLPLEAAGIWFTDPPYYDAIDYAHCSDFFFVWLKRCLPQHRLLRDPHDPANPLTPKAAEIVVDSTTTRGHGVRTPAYYEESMCSAFTEGSRVLSRGGVGCVVFAHKTTEGWEALLSGMIRAGWVVTASWPITTEMSTRLRAHDSAALSASIHLVCRPRPDDAPVGGWEDILRELPARIGDWMERLAGERIRGADLVFSCIGPAMELFSRHPRVETAEGRTVELPEFLEKVWEVVGRTALEQVLGTAEARARNSAAGALEEDARLTALFLWTLQSTNHDEQQNGGNREADEEADEEEEGGAPRKRTKGYALIYDIARRFAQPLGIHLEEWEGRVIEIEKGVVRLLSVSERAQQLFGKDGAAAMAEAFELGRVRDPQLMLFPEEEGSVAPTVRGRAARRGRSRATEEEPARRREPTTLDRVHAAMLLQATGQSGALRALLEDEQRRGPDFFRLANALSALYPKNSEEKRLVDAMLLAVPR